mmetsp:Transcript_68107/g.149588  ORF Transcript_68107/g.149588 Transcript_68107/m.149588 type:complete len:200 (+) Transcript_68107:206-805(+)
MLHLLQLASLQQHRTITSFRLFEIARVPSAQSHLAAHLSSSLLQGWDLHQAADAVSSSCSAAALSWQLPASALSSAAFGFLPWRAPRLLLSAHDVFLFVLHLFLSSSHRRIRLALAVSFSLSFWSAAFLHLQPYHLHHEFPFPAVSEQASFQTSVSLPPASSTFACLQQQTPQWVCGCHQRPSDCHSKTPMFSLQSHDP